MAFWRLYYHLVWATKERLPFLQPEIEPRLYKYMTNRARGLGVKVWAANGWVDHVHFIVSIPPKLSLADFVQEIKGSSSHFLNHSCELPRTFAWQRGYGVFSLGESQKPYAIQYVEMQKEHHLQQTTNSWLEHTVETDAGPDETPIETEHKLQEAPALYLTGGGNPF
jgi:putative transposase